MSYIESVPVGLWTQLRERFAVPGEPIPRQSCNVVQLDEKKVGFPGAVGITPSSREHQDNPVRFCFWSRMPGVESCIDNDPIFVVRAGTFNSGMWSYGSGEKKQEMVYIDFCHTTVTLMTPNGKHIARLISLMCLLAAELSKGVVGESFWERERWPDRVYDEP